MRIHLRAGPRSRREQHRAPLLDRGETVSVDRYDVPRSVLDNHGATAKPAAGLFPMDSRQCVQISRAPANGADAEASAYLLRRHSESHPNGPDPQGDREQGQPRPLQTDFRTAPDQHH